MSEKHTSSSTASMADNASMRSTSTMSSLKALLPSHNKDKEAKDKKKKASLPRETVEAQATRREAAATYMAMR